MRKSENKAGQLPLQQALPLKHLLFKVDFSLSFSCSSLSPIGIKAQVLQTSPRKVSLFFILHAPQPAGDNLVFQFKMRVCWVFEPFEESFGWRLVVFPPFFCRMSTGGMSRLCSPV
ncbi:hypothetical protein XENOCAPTIV_006924 [Xenoophorus captivus]|uniref:Uncharacterized protein n=1 Tax=Xenoophorus captivus TaxID=1517983 RepID=A0ABV0RQN7_9TELE